MPAAVVRGLSRAPARRASGLRRGLPAALSVVLLSAALVVPAARAAVPPPEQDPFYTYRGPVPLASIAPGSVLKTRTLAYHVLGIPLPVKAVQLLYRSTGEIGQPTVNVTSVLAPPHASATPNIVAYQSFYDSLDPADDPSYAIAGGLTLGGIVPNIESLLIAPELLAGNAVVVADTEGESANFAAGREYGLNTIDSLRAALQSPATGLAGSQKIALIGYSGGAIATEWAAELAPAYAPGLDRRIVGASFGGVLVEPAHNLHYVDGSALWAGVIPMATIGISRAFHIDLRPYLSEYGLQLYEKLQSASIVQVLGRYPGLTWEEMAKPQYKTPESIPIYDEVANQLIMGTGGTPTAPLLIAQGAGGEREGTSGKTPGIGPGDGVMITGDVRTLAREYCQRGVTVQYDQYNELAHVETLIPWVSTTLPWLSERFAAAPASQDCAQIEAGNPLTPVMP
jgi:hypothetical protein